MTTVSSAAPPAAKPASGEPGNATLPSRNECMAAHHSAQELKQKEQLVEAQQQLQICSSATCPGAVISDCGNWIADLEQRTPSIVVEVRVDGKPSDDAKVFVDQKPVTDWSHALTLNPGRHVVRAEAPTFEPSEQTVQLPEGQRMRLVSIDFKSPQAAAPPPKQQQPLAPDTTPPTRPTPTVVYPLLGVGVAGLASFTAFALMGRSKQTDLENTCQPHCTDDDLAPMKTSYLIADISGAVGVASLIAAAAFYFSRPTEKSAAAPSVSVAIGPLGPTANPARSFGGSVTTTW
jgi:hypothetical protein